MIDETLVSYAVYPAWQPCKLDYSCLKFGIMNLIWKRIYVLVLVFCFNAFAADAGDQPHIIWASSPVGPNETVLLQAGNFSKAAVVQLARLKGRDPGNPGKAASLDIKDWSKAEILQYSSSAIKFIIPSSWEPGIYACRIAEGNTFSNIVLLNAPDVWWCQGDNGNTSSPGGWIRLVGNCLALNGNGGRARNSLVALRDLQGRFFPLSSIQADSFDIKAQLPSQIPAGNYEVWVHNGFGGTMGWQHWNRIQVKNELPPSATVFNVAELGIEAALLKAEKNGGGIVYFPSGEYAMKSTITIPDNTVLRGEGEDKTIIYWGDLKEIPSALVYGKAFGIEDLSLYCQNMYRDVIKVDSGSFKMKNTRIRADPFFLLGRTERESVFRERKLNGKIDNIGACVYLNGVSRFEILNCDMLGGANGINLRNSSNGLIHDTKVQYGRGGFGCESINRVIVENCIFEGMDLAATGNYFATYWGNSGEYLYLKGNRFANAYGLDQEFFTFDAAGGAYLGKIARLNGNLLTLAADPVTKRYDKNAKDWRNAIICILDGKGCGQYRRIKSHSGRDWEIDQPWAIAPDTSSVISIVPFRGHTLVVNNTFTDGGAVQLYGTAMENIIANNHVTRMSGFLIWGKESKGWGWQPAWYNQILHNEILNGHNYKHQLTQIGIMGTVAAAYRDYYLGPLTKCVVIRGNLIQSNGLISITSQSEDVVVENNFVKNSEFGIVVEKRMQKGIDVTTQYYLDHSMNAEAERNFSGILLRHNKFENVKNPYSGQEISGPGVYKN